MWIVISGTGPEGLSFALIHTKTGGFYKKPCGKCTWLTMDKEEADQTCFELNNK